MTASCVECSAAREAVWYGGYRMQCVECTARALARSHLAHDAIRKGQPLGLREAISRALPNVAYADARRMVMDWWRVDHPQQEETA